MINFLNAAKDSLATDSINVAKEVVQAISDGKTELIIEKLIDQCINVGKNILAAILVYIVGRFLISLLKRMMTSMMERRKVEATIQSFLHSVVNILLNILLIIAVIGALGVNTTSFAALLRRSSSSSSSRRLPSISAPATSTAHSVSPFPRSAGRSSARGFPAHTGTSSPARSHSGRFLGVIPAGNGHGRGPKPAHRRNSKGETRETPRPRPASNLQHRFPRFLRCSERNSR